jgi:flagellar L-ring protein precursor FlgH
MRSGLRLGIASVIICAATLAAQAQNNSLLGGPPSQPDVVSSGVQAAAGAGAAGATPVAVGHAGAPTQGAPGARANWLASSGEGRRAPKNPVLLAASPIAVAAPELRQHRVHDLVTIIVREDKRSVSDARLNSQKKWEVDSELKRWFRFSFHDDLVGREFADPQPGIDFTFDNKYDGKGKVDRTDTLVLRITAQIVDVKPNGLLVLEARKTIEHDEERQCVTLTGSCRSEDVTAQNTVLSTQVADLEIRAEHKGAARDAARRGWLMRLIDLARPI